VGALGEIDWWVAEFGLGDESLDPTSSPNRLVLVPVGEFDRRAVMPVEQAWHIPATERRALHVVTDEDAASELATRWMHNDLSFPLSFVENENGIAETIAKVIEVELAGGYDDVVVLVGRLGLRRRLYRMLHDRTADAIGRRVHPMPAVQVGLMTVALI
jgi:hypothetical protein